MNKTSITEIYSRLRDDLKSIAVKNNFSGEIISINCKALTAEEAIGNPEQRDFPIIKGKEKMIEAVFREARGQAFTDEFSSTEFSINDILDMDIDSSKKRAQFIASFNSVYRYTGLCEKTIHCRDNEPVECAGALSAIIKPDKKILLIGLQPRFLEFLSAHNKTRAIDMDADNIGNKKYGILIESPDKTEDAVNWCDLIFATGSTIVNGTITSFLNTDKPAVFYGVTISAPARVLGLKHFCHCGH